MRIWVMRRPGYRIILGLRTIWVKVLKFMAIVEPARHQLKDCLAVNASFRMRISGHVTGIGPSECCDDTLI